MKNCPTNPWKGTPGKTVNSVTQEGEKSTQEAQVPSPPAPPKMNMGCLESGWTRVKKGPPRFATSSCSGSCRALCPVHKQSSDSGPKGIQAPPGQKWQMVDITVDSGACDHVIGPNVLPGPVVQTEASRNKVPYYSASGEPITNYGMQEVAGYTQDGVEFNMKFNVAAVSKPLASVGRICAAGNQVNFGTQGGSIIGQDGSTSVDLTLQDGTYGLKIWVLVPETTSPIYGLPRNRFAALAEDDEEQGFRRHV